MATTNPYRFTSTDKPKPRRVPFWELGTGKDKHVLMVDANAPIQHVTNYLRDATDPNIGEASAAWSFLQAVMTAEDYEALTTWPMTYDQFQAVGQRAFRMIAAGGVMKEPEDE